MKFEKYNANPKGKKTGDCVIRAICTGLKQDYFQTLDEMVEITKQTGYYMSYKEGFSAYLKSKGYEMEKQPRKFDNTKYTVEEFADKFNKGTYILNLANHVTVIIDGVLYDIWNCRNKSVGNYWHIN